MKAPLWVCIVAAGALAACQQPSQSDAAFGARVKAWLMSHPDDLRAAVENVQKRVDAEQAQADAAGQAKAAAALPKLRPALERDSHDFVANPGGKVTVTEFYDYRCPHCINIAPKVVALIRSRPDVRFVFKEMPIFGPTSEHAARAALAAKAEGKDYVGLYAALMAARPLTDESIDQIAASNGIRASEIQSPAAAAADDAHMAETARLATALSIDGTPAFVVGDTIVRGEDYDALMAAIAKSEART